MAQAPNPMYSPLGPPPLIPKRPAPLPPKDFVPPTQSPVVPQANYPPAFSQPGSGYPQFQQPGYQPTPPAQPSYTPAPQPGFPPSPHPTQFGGAPQNYQPNFSQPQPNFSQPGSGYPQFQQPGYQPTPPQPSYTPAPQPGFTPSPQPTQFGGAPQNYQPSFSQPAVPTPAPQPTASAAPQPKALPPTPNPTSQPSLQQQGSSGGFFSSVSKFFKAKEDPKDAKKELMSGYTPPPQMNVPAATDRHWDNLKNDKNAEADYYIQLANQVDMNRTNVALQKAEEAQQIGMATLTELVRQGDTLSRTERDVETIHLQLDRGDRQLRSISGITGSVANLIAPDNAAKQQRRVYNSYQNDFERTVEVQDFSKPYYQQHQDFQQRQASLGAGQPRAPQASGGASQVLLTKLDEQDKQIEQLSLMVNNLHSIAGTMNVELSAQNTQLDRISNRTDDAIRRTHESNYKMQRLM